MATPTALTDRQDPVAIETPGSVDKSSPKNAPESSAKVMNVVLRVLEGIGLIFANIITFGLINFIPAIHDEYQKVFGGKQVEAMKDEELNTTQTTPDPADTKESTDETLSTKANPPAAPIASIPAADATSAEDSATQKLWTLWEAGKEGASQVYQACTKENAQRAYNKTKESVSQGLSHVNRENAQKAYETATDPRNIRKTFSAVGAVAIGVLGLGMYTYSGGSAGEIAGAAFNVTANATGI